MGFIECVADDGEVVVCDASVSTVEANVEVQDTYLGGYRSTECSLLYAHTLLLHRPCGVSPTCQVFEINIFNDCAKIYIRRRDRNGVDRNLLRAESHG